MKFLKKYMWLIIFLFIGVVLLVGGYLYCEKYTGYCQIKGTYGNRYVVCYGKYSPYAKRNAERKARECNRNPKPVGGCTSTYR